MRGSGLWGARARLQECGWGQGRASAGDQGRRRHAGLRRTAGTEYGLCVVFLALMGMDKRKVKISTLPRMCRAILINCRNNDAVLSTGAPAVASYASRDLRQPWHTRSTPGSGASMFCRRPSVVSTAPT